MLRRRDRDPLRHARATVRWALLVYAVTTVAFAAALDAGHPDVYDVEYASRLALLRTRQAEAPDRPLLLAVGSSRTVMAFAPEQLPPLRTPAGEDVLPFNFGHIGSGPVQNLMEASRMLADGLRPRWVLLELLPTQVAHEGMAFIALHTTARDIPVMHDHMSWHHLYGDYALRQLRLAPKYPGELLRRYAPDLAPPPLAEPTDLLPLGGCTFLRDDITPEDRVRATAVTRLHHYDSLQKFQISPPADRATRALLARLRREGVETVMVLMPEGPELRSRYAPGADDRLAGFCAALTREYGVPVVDARDWLPAADMYDEHHVLRRGAAAFTARLDREVLGPLVAHGASSVAAR
jgi:hypothetical protein